jgi:acyl-coenzyme A thioesterase PaaI-like protein
MKVSEKALKWALRFYPPLLLQRVWVRRIGKDFMSAEVRVVRSPFNLNYNRSIFGGTIFSAVDPFYAVLYFEALRRKGYRSRIWVTRAEIEYLKPAYSDLFFTTSITPEELRDTIAAITAGEKVRRTHEIELRNKSGELCCRVLSEVYIRKS